MGERLGGGRRATSRRRIRWIFFHGDGRTAFFELQIVDVPEQYDKDRRRIPMLIVYVHVRLRPESIAEFREATIENARHSIQMAASTT